MLRHTGILISEISLDDLDPFLRKIVQEELARHFNNLSVPKQKVEEELISKKAASAFLKVSLPTLGKLVINGIVPCHRLGANLRFRKSELDKCLITIRNKKHNRLIK